MAVCSIDINRDGVFRRDTTMKWDVYFGDHMNDPRIRAYFEKVRREVIT
jgi:hypothetical protein